MAEAQGMEGICKKCLLPKTWDSCILPIIGLVSSNLRMHGRQPRAGRCSGGGLEAKLRWSAEQTLVIPAANGG